MTNTNLIIVKMYLLVFFGLLLNIPNLLCDCLEGILVICVLVLKIFEGIVSDVNLKRGSFISYLAASWCSPAAPSLTLICDSFKTWQCPRTDCLKENRMETWGSFAEINAWRTINFEQRATLSVNITQRPEKLSGR